MLTRLPLNTGIFFTLSKKSGCGEIRTHNLLIVRLFRYYFSPICTSFDFIFSAHIPDGKNISTEGCHPKNSTHINLTSCDLYLQRFLDILAMTKMTPYWPEMTPDRPKFQKFHDFKHFNAFFPNFQWTSWIKMLKTLNKARIC